MVTTKIHIIDSQLKRYYVFPGHESLFLADHADYFPEQYTPVLMSFPLENEWAVAVFGSETTVLKLDPERYRIEHSVTYGNKGEDS